MFKRLIDSVLRAVNPPVLPEYEVIFKQESGHHAFYGTGVIRAPDESAALKEARNRIGPGASVTLRRAR